MALTNAEKQARWKARNVVVLTGEAEAIARKLVEMDQGKLARVMAILNGAAS